MHIWS